MQKRSELVILISSSLRKLSPRVRRLADRDRTCSSAEPIKAILRNTPDGTSVDFSHCETAARRGENPDERRDRAIFQLCLTRMAKWETCFWGHDNMEGYLKPALSWLSRGSYGSRIAGQSSLHSGKEYNLRPK